MKIKKSFTLIELIIYIGLFSTVLVILTQIITSTLNVQLESQSMSSVEQDGRYILSRFSYDIPRATSITRPTALEYGNNSINELKITINGVTYHYYLNNGNLMLDYPPAISVQLNSFDTTISNLYFTRFDSRNPTPTTSVANLDEIQINFVLASKSQSKSGPQTRNFETTLGLRCYSNCL
jgi:type II secretory pathway component PulJ